MKKVILAVYFVLFSSVFGMEDQNAEWFDAVKSGDLAAVDRLIEGGIDLNIKDVAGDTALMTSAVMTVEDLHIETKYGGDTALMIATSKHDYKMVKRLIDGRCTEVIRDFLIRRKKSGFNLSDKSVLKWRDQVSEAGADVNAKDDEGHTALMRATERGHESIVKLLINNGAEF